MDAGIGSGSRKSTTLGDVHRELDSVHRTMNGVKDRLGDVEKAVKATNRRLDGIEKETKARFDALDAAVAEVKSLIVSLPPVEFRSGKLSVTGGIQTRSAEPDEG